MRFATIVINPGPAGFYPEYHEVVDDANITRERIHYISLLDDGTIVGLYELRANRERLRSQLETLPRIVSFDVAGDECVFLYLQEEATEPARTLLQEVQKREVVLDHPIEYMIDGTIRVTLIGDGTTLRQTLDVFEDVVDVRLEEMGEYHPELGEFTSLLTDRQLEILRVAVENGYYEIPRRVTHQDLAEECDLSQSTVAEHLQKIEASVLPHVLR